MMAVILSGGRIRSSNVLNAGTRFTAPSASCTFFASDQTELDPPAEGFAASHAMRRQTPAIRKARLYFSCTIARFCSLVKG
jgi:hypothetical protein